MAAFLDLLRKNRNYRYTWMGQVVSEVGDHFNNIAVFSLALTHTSSGRPPVNTRYQPGALAVTMSARAS